MVINRFCRCCCCHYFCALSLLCIVTTFATPCHWRSILNSQELRSRSHPLIFADGVSCCCWWCCCCWWGCSGFLRSLRWAGRWMSGPFAYATCHLPHPIIVRLQRLQLQRPALPARRAAVAASAAASAAETSTSGQRGDWLRLRLLLRLLLQPWRCLNMDRLSDPTNLRPSLAASCNNFLA